MPDVVDEEEYQLTPDVRIRVERAEMQTGADQITVHTYQETGNERHRVTKFKVEDEDEKLAYYIPTRGRSEPWQMGLVGLQEYGWDCSNFDIEKSEEESEESLNSALTQTTHLLKNVEENTSDEMVADALARARAYTQFAVLAREFEQEHGRPLSESEDVDASELSVTLTDEDDLELLAIVIQTMMKKHVGIELSVGG